jgi:hypothetical protein
MESRLCWVGWLLACGCRSNVALAQETGTYRSGGSRESPVIGGATVGVHRTTGNTRNGLQNRFGWVQGPQRARLPSVRTVLRS